MSFCVALQAGASETAELNSVLTTCMMIRRLKADVLSQLPPKRRTQVSRLSSVLYSGASIKLKPNLVTWIFIAGERSSLHVKLS